MADYVLIRKSKTLASNFLHIVLNIVFAFIAVFSVPLLNSPVLGICLVLISKWRVFAVRSRYWWPNIRANLVDLIVGLSIVTITYFSQSAVSPIINLIFAFIYCAWLLFIKPLSSETATLAQSLIAVFFGMFAITLVTEGQLTIIPVILSFIVGWATSRHVLFGNDASTYGLTTLVSGLIFAETTWLCSRWSIIYLVFGLHVPQLAIILTIFAFVYNYARQLMVKNPEGFEFKKIIGPTIFAIILIGIVVICFSNPIFNI